ncbi:radical SAM protein [Candidatus Wolfebacteria bacterium]|nr:radical SAM protein [Candidatus Wolfebacteria bacterium]
MAEIKKFESKYSIYTLESFGDKIFINRKVKETGVVSKFFYYINIDKNGNSKTRRIDEIVGKKIIGRALKDDNISSALMIVEGEKINKKKNKIIDFSNKSKEEYLFTSTGDKFFYHKKSLNSFKNNTGKTIISTHISPEGTCNLRCPYCSVAYRNSIGNRIELDIIKKYVNILKKRGLKAVILTGGGEPTLYPKINELIEFLYDKSKLELAMITNGTVLDRIFPKNRKKFRWLRVSVNLFDGWEKKINIPKEFINPKTIIGFSHIYTLEHNFGDKEINYKKILRKIIKLMDKFNVQYLRLLPNCLIKGDKFNYQHKAIDRLVSSFKDKRIFHQLKIHQRPDFKICYQSYFRPYLSEEKNPWTKKPGTVFPCDSIVLNSSVKKFLDKYAICEPERIGEYMDKKIKHKFKPPVDCEGCVFVKNNKILEYLANSSEKEFESYFKKVENKKIKHLHKNFI